MADFATVLQNLRDEDAFNEAANFPEIQFAGPRNQVYLGATLLPEQQRDSNQYDEEDFHLTDLIAADVDAYSPPPFMGSFARASSFNVRMGDSGLATQMPTKLYSDIMRLLNNSASMERVASAILSFNSVILQAMLTFNERQRWQAIVDGVVIRKVARTEEPINYPNAVGQRSDIVEEWSDPDYDPIPDLFAQLTRARSLGFAGVARIIASGDVQDIVMNNPHVKRRAAGVAGPDDNVYFGYPDSGRVNAYLNSNQLPAIETYDEIWRSQTGSGRYLPEGTMVFIYQTGRSIVDVLGTDIDEDYVPLDQGTGLGYTGIGTPAGHEDRGPGRYQELVYHGGTRPHVSGAGVQKGLPVFSEPTGFAVYSNIR